MGRVPGKAVEREKHQLADLMVDTLTQVLTVLSCSSDTAVLAGPIRVYDFYGMRCATRIRKRSAGHQCTCSRECCFVLIGSTGGQKCSLAIKPQFGTHYAVISSLFVRNKSANLRQHAELNWTAYTATIKRCDVFYVAR